jgi:hypothetical protein
VIFIRLYCNVHVKLAILKLGWSHENSHKHIKNLTTLPSFDHLNRFRIEASPLSMHTLDDGTSPFIRDYSFNVSAPKNIQSRVEWKEEKEAANRLGDAKEEPKVNE